MKLFIFIILNLTFCFTQAQAPAGSIVAQHGRLQVSGSHVANQYNQKISLAGNSLFWSLDDGNGGEFYTSETLNHLADEWNTSIVRAAMGVKEPFGPGGSDQGYLVDSLKEVSKVNTVVNAAINKGIYVIIDWHSHKAEDYQQEAIDFFTKMAELYGTHPNVIYEIYNEPIGTSWADIKSYAEAVIPAIRSKDPDNLIVVGTRTYSQNVLEASQNQINDNNVAYTLHFYAGERDHDRLRGDNGEAKQAMDNGIALFVTEWGTVPANGFVGVDSVQTLLWMDFLKQNYISHANWSISDKPGEGHPVINANAGFSGLVNNNLTTSGILVKDIIKNWNVTPVNIDQNPDIEEDGTKFEAENAELTGVSKVDDGSASGGQYVTGFINDNDRIIFRNINVASPGTYTLKIRYASSSYKENYIKINNGSKVSFSFPPSNGAFTDISYDIDLNQGNNTITIEKHWGWFNVDYIKIGGLEGDEPDPPQPDPPQSGEAVTLEAENADLLGVDKADNESASGGQYVTGFTDDNDRIVFNNINAPSAGTYPLTIRYACTSDKQNYVQINNGNKENILFPISTTFTDKTITVNLTQGNNSITIEKHWGWFDVDYIKIGGLEGDEPDPPQPDPPQSGEAVTLEAENASLFGIDKSDNESASGGQYVTGFTDDNDRVVFNNINAPSAGTYPLTIRYACTSDKQNYVQINNGNKENILFPTSATFTDKTITINLNQGNNTITIEKHWGWFDVDYIKIGGLEGDDEPDPPQPGETVRLEAEDGVFTGVDAIDETSASNSQYVTGFDNAGDKIAVSTTIETAGMYQLIISYRANGGTKTNDLYLNDTFLQHMVFQQSDVFTEIKVADFYFEAGQNTIGFVKNWGWMDVDYFKLIPAENQSGNSSNNFCDRPLQVSYNTTTENYVGGIINSDATILNNNSVEFRGTQEINLNNGFTVRQGGEFTTGAEECAD